MPRVRDHGVLICGRMIVSVETGTVEHSTERCLLLLDRCRSHVIDIAVLKLYLSFLHRCMPSSVPFSCTTSGVPFAPFTGGAVVVG